VHGNRDIEQHHPIPDSFQFVLPVDEHVSNTLSGLSIGY